MFIYDIRKKNDKELKELLFTLNEELFALSFQHAVGKLPNTHKIKIMRKDIAKIKTIIKERELKINLKIKPKVKKFKKPEISSSKSLPKISSTTTPPKINNVDISKPITKDTPIQPLQKEKANKTLKTLTSKKTTKLTKVQESKPQKSVIIKKAK